MHILFSALTEALVVLAALHLVTLGQYVQPSSFRFSSSEAIGILSSTPAKCLLFFTSEKIANPGCGLPRALEALGVVRTFIVRGMEAVMLETLSQEVAAVLLAFLDIRHLVSLWVVAIHVRYINARRTDLVANPVRGVAMERV